MRLRNLWLGSVVAVVLVQASAGLLLAADSPANRPMRIGVVRVEVVFKEYQYAKDQEAKIKSEFNREKAVIDGLKKQIKTRLDRLRNDPLTPHGSKEWKLGMLEIEKLKIRLEDRQRKFNRDVRKRMAEFYRSIYEDFRAVVQAVGQKYQYDLIITSPSPELSKDGPAANNPEGIRTEILLRRIQYIGKKQGVDITAFVIQEMNKVYAKRKAAKAKLKLP